MRQRNRGFTLIELMVVLAVGAILLSVGVPALQSFTINAKQSAAINDFVSSMHVARSTAITTHARAVVCASASGEACDGVSWIDGWIVFNDANGNQLVDADERIVNSSDGNDDLIIVSGQFVRSIVYRPNGRVANGAGIGSAGEFTICDDRGAEHAKALIIDLSGRPRVSEYTANGDVPSCI